VALQKSVGVASDPASLVPASGLDPVFDFAPASGPLLVPPQMFSQPPAGLVVQSVQNIDSRLSSQVVSAVWFTVLPGPQLGPNALPAG
jgi:hypothetical protein